ncbi:uncharacterized protein ACOB8E_004884 [Sarcophilus harrisii]
MRTTHSRTPNFTSHKAALRQRQHLASHVVPFSAFREPLKGVGALALSTCPQSLRPHLPGLPAQTPQPPPPKPEGPSPLSPSGPDAGGVTEMRSSFLPFCGSRSGGGSEGEKWPPGSLRPPLPRAA